VSEEAGALHNAMGNQHGYSHNKKQTFNDIKKKYRTIQK